MLTYDPTSVTSRPPGRRMIRIRNLWSVLCGWQALPAVPFHLFVSRDGQSGRVVCQSPKGIPWGSSFNALHDPMANFLGLHSGEGTNIQIQHCYNINQRGDKVWPASPTQLRCRIGSLFIFHCGGWWSCDRRHICLLDTNVISTKKMMPWIGGWQPVFPKAQ